MAKRRPRGKKASRLGGSHSWGGAFGSRKRGAGYHNLGRGIRRNAYGERFYVYDAGYVLPVPPAPLSPAAAFPLFADWIEEESQRATDYLRKRTGNPRLLPRIMAGAITIERGRLFQPWVPRERSSDYGMLAADLLLTLQGYKSLEAADDPDSRANKSGVLGWFIRARTQPIYEDKPHKKSKREPADTGDPFGKIEPGDFDRADTKAARKKGKGKRSIRRVGRGSKAKKDQGKRQVGARAGKHRVARRGSVRRKRQR